MANDEGFKPVSNPSAPQVAAKILESRGKMTRVELRLQLWVPSTTLKVENDAISLPNWVIANNFK